MRSAGSRIAAGSAFLEEVGQIMLDGMLNSGIKLGCRLDGFNVVVSLRLGASSNRNRTLDDSALDPSSLGASKVRLADTDLAGCRRQSFLRCWISADFAEIIKKNFDAIP